MHPDETVGRFRLPDTVRIRAYFEKYPEEFRSALEEYHEWKDWPRSDWTGCQSRQIAVMNRAVRAGADFADWTCVLRCAVALISKGFPCPPWTAERPVVRTICGSS